MAENLSIAVLFVAAIAGSLILQAFNIVGEQVIYPIIPIAVLAILLHKFEDGIVLAAASFVAVGLISRSINGDQTLILAGAGAVAAGIAGIYLNQYRDQNGSLKYLIAVWLSTIAFELAKNILNGEIYILNPERFLGSAPAAGIHLAANLLIAAALTAYLPEGKKEEKKV